MDPCVKSVVDGEPNFACQVQFFEILETPSRREIDRLHLQNEKSSAFTLIQCPPDQDKTSSKNALVSNSKTKPNTCHLFSNFPSSTCGPDPLPPDGAPLKIHLIFPPGHAQFSALPRSTYSAKLPPLYTCSPVIHPINPHKLLPPI